jgi:hypothetical protein
MAITHKCGTRRSRNPTKSARAFFTHAKEIVKSDVSKNEGLIKLQQSCAKNAEEPTI